MTAIAGITRRISMPRKTPIVKAASVQPGTPGRVTNTVAAPAVMPVSRMGGPKNQANSVPRAPDTAASEIAISTSLASGPYPAEAPRPRVPERAGLQFPGQHRALANAPISTGARFIRIRTVLAIVQSVLVSARARFSQAAAPAPWQAASAA